MAGLAPGGEDRGRTSGGRGDSHERCYRPQYQMQRASFVFWQSFWKTGLVALCALLVTVVTAGNQPIKLRITSFLSAQDPECRITSVASMFCPAVGIIDSRLTSRTLLTSSVCLTSSFSLLLSVILYTARQSRDEEAVSHQSGACKTNFSIEGTLDMSFAPQ